MRRGTVIVNHGTGTPANAQQLAELAGDRGVHVLDAPVSGGRPVAESRSLTVFVGGDEQVFDRCGQVFEAFSTHVVRIGDVLSPAGEADQRECGERSTTRRRIHALMRGRVLRHHPTCVA